MGNELFNKVVELSGLPKDIIERELTELLKKEGIHPKDVTEPVLRKILAKYLKDIVGKMGGEPDTPNPRTVS